MSFYALQISLEESFYAFPKKPDKHFRTTLKERTFALVGKKLEHLQSKDILYVQVLQVFKDIKF